MSALKNSLFDWCKFNNKEYLLDEWDISKNKLSTEEITYASSERVTVQTLLAGPGGFLQVDSVWEGSKLITFIFIG